MRFVYEVVIRHHGVNICNYFFSNRKAAENFQRVQQIGNTSHIVTWPLHSK